MSTRRFVSAAGLFVLTAGLGTAQNIAPAHSGTVHYFEGDVTVDGTKLVSQVARFTELKEQSVLQTGMGRAEILLTPGVLLRVGENSSVKMLDNRLISTRVEFLSGISMVEAVDNEGSTVKDPAVTIVYKDFQAQPVHFGLFEMSSQPSQLRVFKGEARVTGNGATVNVKDGNQIALTTVMATSKFDTKDGDDLYVWSRDRSAYLSAGNMASARALAASGYAGNGGLGYGGSGFGSSYGYGGWNPATWRGFSGGWYYNSYLGMYSYLPFSGTMYSPFGFGFYNPITIGYVYDPNGYNWAGAGGARTGATTGLQLPSVAPTSGSSGVGRTQLPRLGTTATLRPTTVAPAARGSGPISAARNVGFNPVNNVGAASAASAGFGSTARIASPVSSAPASAPMTISAPPAMAAPAAAASAPAGARGR